MQVKLEYYYIEVGDGEIEIIPFVIKLIRYFAVSV
jgi:hypothetical protein